jgi:hypothetical protein
MGNNSPAIPNLSDLKISLKSTLPKLIKKNSFYDFSDIYICALTF